MRSLRLSLTPLFALAAVALPSCAAPPSDDGTATSNDDLRTGVVRIYASTAFDGDKESLGLGDHDLVGTSWNDAARSLRIFGDYTVDLFSEGGFKGTQVTISSDTTDLGALDGQVSSLRIRAKTAGGGSPPPVPTVTPPPAPTGTGTTPPPPPASGGPIGWASVAGLGQTSTTGGAGAATVTVKTIADFNTHAAGTTPAIIQVSGTLSGDVAIGSNKTIVGLAGSEIHGHIDMKGSVNVIVRNLKVVGYNCTDNADCQSGADAITVVKGAHHLWFDHCDISDGSDGNLDITHASDFVTISWTKFSYSAKRAGGHEFSNLIGHTDVNPEDEGHLKVTLHHDWWADNVGERMPRVRYGQIHSFNNLFSAAGNNYCIRAGVHSLVLTENDAFVGVSTPFDLAGGDVLSRGNLFVKTTGNTTDTGKAFTPPYKYSLDAASTVEAAVRAGAGTH